MLNDLHTRSDLFSISLAGLAVLVHKSARRKDIAPRDDDDEDTED